MLLSGVYLLAAIAYLFAVPLWESPDEPAHYGYIAYVAEEGRLPVPSGESPLAYRQIGMYEWHHPPLYYLAQAALLRSARAWLGEKWGQIPPPSPNPGFSFAYATRRFLVPAGWWAVDEPYASVALLRIASLLLTLPIIPISFWTANELLGSVERAALATAALALVPQYLFIHAGIKNDGLADLSASVVLGLLIFLAKRPARARQLRWLVLLSLALSLDLLSKLTNVLPLILIVAWSLWQLAKKQWRASHIAALYGPLALVVGGYLAATPHGRSVMSYWLGASQSHPHFGGSALELLNLLSTSTWARFGWMNVEVAPPITTLLSVIILVGIALSAADLVCHAERQDQRPAAAIGLLSFVVALPLVIAFGVLQNPPQGRFLFPVLGLLIVTAERGYFAYAPAWGRLVSRGLPLFLLGLNVASLVRLAAVYGS